MFLDRDGVINVKIDNSYVLSEQDLEILPGIPAFMAWAKKHFRLILVITNQQCVGKGLLSLTALDTIHRLINQKTGSLIDDFFVCPHLVQDQCGCRKPNEQLFLKAAEKYNVDFANSWMIGDAETDIIPAKKLGIKTIFFSTRTSQIADLTIPDSHTLLAEADQLFTPR
ncbi:D-glycero-alpha-D-manno-heptose-1,7-bisphosphate 7-phosphatase [Botryobacter ruber]|uniref:D-glycero-alpha-D-manno-heptose-1,7-bisphosphate 7-phosphatase n=1 Tax=Botryobacter ruber TaxID=2171629 RepID=UPI0013E2A0F4|nr:HAD-IIIA family hydrolase [Botryobacter ruber]